MYGRKRAPSTAGGNRKTNPFWFFSPTSQRKNDKKKKNTKTKQKKNEKNGGGWDGEVVTSSSPPSLPPPKPQTCDKFEVWVCLLLLPSLPARSVFFFRERGEFGENQTQTHRRHPLPTVASNHLGLRHTNWLEIRLRILGMSDSQSCSKAGNWWLA